jgi:hypothetical protein
MTATAVTDPAAGTITWTVPRRSVQGLKTGAKLTGLEVTSAATVHVQQDGNSFSAASVSDTGSTSKAYTDGTKTCLKGV